jgi:hypothetical protein
LALLAITGGVVLPPEEPEPLVPVEPPEVPEPLLLPDPLVLPEPLVPPDPLDVPDPPAPLELPELLDPLELPDPVAPDPPESVEPLVVEADDCPLLSPLPPPHAVIANATTATSNPLRTNDVFIMEQYSLGNTVGALACADTNCNPHATAIINGRARPTYLSRTADPVLQTRRFSVEMAERSSRKRMLLMFPQPRHATRG